MKNIFLCATIFFTFSSLYAQNPRSISSLRFIGEHEIRYDERFDSTVVGGLSGIDYDAKRKVFYVFSDDRGTRGPIRFYTMKIGVTARGIEQVQIQKVTSLLAPGNKPYERNMPDPEGMRLNAALDQLYWVSEGERVVNDNSKLLVDPFINVAGLDGKYKSSIALPENTRVRATPKGPRQNSALEGITFDSNFRHFYIALEEPLYEDGPRADTIDNGAMTRIYKFDVATGKLLAQFAYPLDKVAYPPSPRDKFRINGVSEILHLSSETILTVERSFSTGRLPCTIKVFLTDLSAADDVSQIESLKEKPGIRPAKKKLLLNFDDLGIYIDNIEGVTFGPTLPNGNRTLIFVSDNNFNWFEKTQLLLFEVMPSH
jgi:hypothetical protein